MLLIDAATKICFATATIRPDMANIVAVSTRGCFDPLFERQKASCWRRGFVDRLLLTLIFKQITFLIGRLDIEHRCIGTHALASGPGPFSTGLEFEIR